MQRFGGVVRDTAGNGLASTTVTVYATGTTTPSTIYADNAFTTLANPFTANVDGTWLFYAAPGRYDVKYTKSGYTFGTAPSYDQLGYDYMSSITPAQITANQNNYAPTNGLNVEQWRLSTDAARTITGISATTAVSGQSLTIFNVGSFSIVLSPEDALSTAANRMVTGMGLYTIQAGQSALLKYDLASLRWRVITSSASTTVATSIRETSGPTDLAVAAIADTQYIKRSGTTVVGVTPPFASEFISADQVVTYSSALNVAHGFGSRPKLVQVTLKCAVGEAGYSIGDEIPIGGSATNQQNFEPDVTVSLDATNVTLVTSTALKLVQKATFAAIVITAANWRYVVRAWK